ncbi:hypothetical protein COCCU_02410 [Corynebacterium occultum]|uniref:Uncharacterized protein n=1 Tax=Corynebacterium occultum TaxID=2675219 RepID=A0A6B8W6B6_9CORY|nr:hypothetical protein COCCU_02410 [Corynebacterium occultum]
MGGGGLTPAMLARCAQRIQGRHRFRSKLLIDGRVTAPRRVPGLAGATFCASETDLGQGVLLGGTSRQLLVILELMWE